MSQTADDERASRVAEVEAEMAAVEQSVSGLVEPMRETTATVTELAECMATVSACMDEFGETRDQLAAHRRGATDSSAGVTVGDD